MVFEFKGIDEQGVAQRNMSYLGKLVKLTTEMRLPLVRKIGVGLLASHQTRQATKTKIQIRIVSDGQTGRDAGNDVALSLLLQLPLTSGGIKEVPFALTHHIPPQRRRF
ncbi:hypothetical protein ACJRO7_008297 [Eucalyptus globulus]|uniref:Uncharacterized protein n=1 Tax=Eucalyptus globulus TaxID=34317 RepID=A0ABD3IR29_EUCGL